MCDSWIRVVLWIYPASGYEITRNPSSSMEDTDEIGMELEARLAKWQVK